MGHMSLHASFLGLLCCCALVIGCGDESQKPVPSEESSRQSGPLSEDSDRGAAPLRAGPPVEPQSAKGPSATDSPVAKTPPAKVPAKQVPKTSDWCGTARLFSWRAMEHWKGGEKGHYTRSFVKRTPDAWLVTSEWAESDGVRLKVVRTEQKRLILDRHGSTTKPQDLVERWVRELDHDDEAVVFRAAISLGVHGDSQALPGIIRVLQTHPGKHARLAAALALGNIGGDDAAPILIDELDSKEKLVRLALLDSIRQITGHEIDLGEDPESWDLHRAWRRWWFDNQDLQRGKKKK